MIDLAWGGHRNGQIDLSNLVDVSGRGDYLEATAAAQWLRMRDACHTDTGVWLEPAAGSSAYRPESVQIEFFTERYVKVSYNTGLWWNGSYWTKKSGVAVAAIPGTSNHGWGRAIDLTGYENDPAVWQWLLDHAAEYGYSWATGRVSGERWHWECLTPPGTTVAAVSASPITEHTETEDYTMTQGAFYRLNDGETAIGSIGPGSIFYQEEPHTPLLPIQDEWWGYAANGNKTFGCTTQQLTGIINTCGVYKTDPKNHNRRILPEPGVYSYNGFSVWLP